MKTARLIFLVGLLISLFSGCNRDNRSLSADKRYANLKKTLDLTNQQSDKIKVIMENTEEKLKELRTQSSDSREVRVSAAHTIRQEEQKQIREILTPEQQEKYDAFLRDRMKKKGKGKFRN